MAHGHQGASIFHSHVSVHGQGDSTASDLRVIRSAVEDAEDRIFLYERGYISKTKEE